MRRMLNGNKLRFILSAGRTGTVFLSQSMGMLFPQHQIVHEPKSSRRMFMAYNAEMAGLLPTGTARSIFVRNRTRVIEQIPENCVRLELNPFLHPLAPSLHELVSPLHVVHLVRDARSWIESIVNFGASGWKKHIIEFLPFARTIPDQVRKEWRRLDTIGKFAWRWRMANDQILTVLNHTDNYRIIRFEDLFGSDDENVSDAFSSLISILPGSATGSTDDLPWLKKANRSERRIVNSWQSWPNSTKAQVDDICGELLLRFGYVATSK